MKNFYIILGLYYLLVCFLFGYLKKIISIKNNAINYWMIGFFISGVGILTYTLFDNHTENLALFIFSVVFNFFAIAGAFFIYHGYNIYEGKKSNLGVLITLPILSFLCSLIFSLVYPNDSLRMASNGVIVSVCYLYIAYKIRNKQLSKFHNNKYLYYIAAFIHSTRIYNAFFINKDYFMPETIIPKIFVGIGCLLAMIIIFNIIIVLMTDINRALNEQLVTKDKLYRVVSHDVKGQLNNLVNYHYILKQSHKDWSEQKINNWVQEIENIAISSYTLLENMLLWSSKNQKNIQLTFEKHNFNELVHNAITFYSSQMKFKNQEIIFLNQTDIFLLCDKNILDSILRNLIENSIKHSDSYEKIYISVEENNSQIHFSIKNKINDNYDIHIQNIDVAIHNKTVKNKGYGLMICKDFIEKHSGELTYKTHDKTYLEIGFYVPFLKDDNEE